MQLTDEQVKELEGAEYGAPTTIKLDDGRLVRCKVEIDEDASINDSECYGRTEQYSHRYWGDDGRAPRPDDFDGNAEKIQIDRGAWIWWQPPTGDMAPGEMVEDTWQPFKRGSKGFAEFRQSVCDLLEMGFQGVILELCDGTDAYGRPIVKDVASLWGIDSLENGYLAEVIREMALELQD